jgi:hypothetical protein
LNLFYALPLRILKDYQHLRIALNARRKEHLAETPGIRISKPEHTRSTCCFSENALFSENTAAFPEIRPYFRKYYAISEKQT